mmetsp:Transcript_150405/g.273612  ORF Transcript_150405/g.273612 Transcript_150405/m.273612 type:complete len:683 (-) Transcript_150405:119-2167(-)
MKALLCLMLTAGRAFKSALGAEVSAMSTLSLDEAGAKNRPVTKVVTLLKDMQKTLEKEAEEDEEIYNKMACWCTTNDKAKAEGITDHEDHIEALKSSIEELTANSAKLTQEIARLEKEVAANQEALEKATETRKKEFASFTAEEQDLLETIAALKNALTVLSKHNGESFLQKKHTTAIRTSLQKHGARVAGALTRSEKKILASFLQKSDDADGAPHLQEYAAQSGEIFGILSQMKETFESDLASSQSAEAGDQKSYEALKASKTAEIAAGTDQRDSKVDERSETDEKLALAKEDLADTKKTLSADEAYLATLKDTCSLTDKEYEERLKTRQLEMEAVSKALAVLSGDDAHDLFTKTFDFMQEKSTTSSVRRLQASRVLSDAAKEFHNPRLTTLAVKVRLDAFTKVKKAIDDMIAELLKQKEAEIKKKDFCVDELDTNERDTQTNEQIKSDLTTKIADLELKIETLTKSIEKLKADIGDAQVMLKRAGEDREKESANFQMTVSDQKETMALLEKALGILQEFYGKAAFLQKAEPAGPPPPPGFKEYKKNAAATGVTGMIQQIIDDAKAMTAEAIKDEGSAVKSYESLVMETNANIEAMKKEIVDKSEMKAIAEGDLAEAKKDKSNTETTLEELATKKKELLDSCTYVMENFDLRQTARDQEVEALKQAKAILSGAKFEVFLQR